MPNIASASSERELMPPSSTPSRGTILTCVWLVVSLVLLLRIVVGHRRFLAAVGPRVELTSGSARESLDRVRARGGGRRGVLLPQSSVLAPPVAILGWEIVIPAGFERFSDD